MNPEPSPSGYVPPKPMDRGATPSMICGILGLFLCPPASLVGIIMGHKSMGRIRRSGGAMSGEGTAVTGVVSGYFGLFIAALVAVPFGLEHLVPGVNPIQSATENKAMDDLQRKGTELYSQVYYDTFSGNHVGLPDPGEYTSSTDYFKALAGDNPARHRVLHQSPDFVAGPLVPAGAWSLLSPSNNVWNVVEGLNIHTNSGTPFLISANIKATSLTNLSGRVGDNIDPSATGVMARKVVVVHLGGGAYTLTPDDRWPTTGWLDFKILSP